MSVGIRTHSLGVANLPFDVIIIEPRSCRRETSWKTILAYPRSSGRQRAAHLGPVRWAGPQVGPELIREVGTPGARNATPPAVSTGGRGDPTGPRSSPSLAFP
jgi:hypothetical protein